MEADPRDLGKRCSVWMPYLAVQERIFVPDGIGILYPE